MAPPPRSRRSRWDERGAAALPLPLDALYEILLLLPAKDLCRLRAVCRPWLSLLSDARFVAAHAARHPGPLIVAGNGVGSGHPDGDALCDILDLSGRLVKRIRKSGAAMANDSVISAQLDFVQIVRGFSKSCRLLNPATGAVSVLPEKLAGEHEVHDVDILDYRAGVVFGKVASTGDFKVLRVFDNTMFEPSSKQLCEVFTLGGSGSDAQWRAKKASPHPVDVRGSSTAVVNGIVYFFLSEGGLLVHELPRRIASFDLGTEEWGPTLELPQIRFMSAAYGPMETYADNRLSLASLNDCLSVVHCKHPSSIDLWFLMDFKRGWVKQHSIQINPSLQFNAFDVRPLLVLSDGRNTTRGLLGIYNPRTTAYSDLARFRPYVEMGLYTGNLLSLDN